MNAFTARCQSCNTVVSLPSLKARAQSCDACARKRSAALNEARDHAAAVQREMAGKVFIGCDPGMGDATVMAWFIDGKLAGIEHGGKIVDPMSFAKPKPAKRPFAVGDRVVVKRVPFGDDYAFPSHVYATVEEVSAGDALPIYVQMETAGRLSGARDYAYGRGEGCVVAAEDLEHA